MSEEAPAISAPCTFEVTIRVKKRPLGSRLSRITYLWEVARTEPGERVVVGSGELPMLPAERVLDIPKLTMAAAMRIEWPIEEMKP